MKYLISYDIEENKLRHRAQKFLETYARRLQKSVYLAELTAQDCRLLRQSLLSLLHEANEPRLLITPLCAACADRMYVLGEALEPASACVIA